MESTVGVETESRSDGSVLGEKRPADLDVVEDGSGLGSGSPPKKRNKLDNVENGNGDGIGLVSDVKKVAEMVLVLAAMGKMRGGRVPTDAEKELMAEARSCLAKVCEGFAPKDVFPGDAFGGVIEDLGLSMLKEQRLGFRPPNKVSIAEKLLLSKKKMEKTEDFSLPSTPHTSQRPQGKSGSVSESASHPVQMSQVAKPGHISTTSGNLQSTSSLGHVNTASPASLPYQLPTSEIRPIVASALPSSHSVSAAMPKIDRSHLRSDGRSNGSAFPSQIQANYPANSTVRTPAWSVQPQSASSVKVVSSGNKVPANVSLKVEGGADAKSGLAPQAASRTVVGGPPSQTTNHVSAPPLGNTHAEIGKIVQKLLQPKVSERPTWNPPSRDYMNKPLTCQMCMSTVTEIDTILICDACEKGYHLKCLQTTSQKGVPRGEWHCAKCLSSSNGKPLPPKYGRVMRNINTAKAPSSAAAPSTPSKKVAASDEKVGLQKVTMNGSISKQNVPATAATSHSGPLLPGSQSVDAKRVPETNSVLSGSKPEQIASGPNPNSQKALNAGSLSSEDSSVDKMSDDKKVESTPNSSTKLENTLNHPDESRTLVSTQDGNLIPPTNESTPSNEPQENQAEDSKASRCDWTSNNANALEQHVDGSSKLKEHERDNPSDITAGTGDVNQGGAQSDGLLAVNWVGDPTQVLDDKIYYASCHINGHVYKAADHALVRFNGGKPIPSKLLGMWEDKNTGTQWVSVSRCYFPGDLPESVGRPCGLESSEVYESTSGETVMAGLMESPCEVLPPREFAEESERRTRTGSQPNGLSPPLFLCKWIYDQVKGLFRDISC